MLDTEPFQRLRYVRQLGHAFLVYPGATHTRFEHALGAYHLARRALGILADRGELDSVPDEESPVIRLAALLHDIGHFPFSHALEEAGLPSHELLATRKFSHPDLASALERIGIPDLTDRLSDLIAGQGHSPLRGLISGSLDLDKIEYLTRDARMTGVPYGSVDVDRLLHSLTVVQLDDGNRVVGIRKKGISALESLLFARYQMYRNVYWHHTVRSATAMFKRVVRNALGSRRIAADWVAEATDETLMERLRATSDDPLVGRLRRRDLLKRLADIPSEQVPRGAGEWLAAQPDLAARVEDQLATELGVDPGEVLLDYPLKVGMLDVDLPLLSDKGVVEHLGSGGASGLGIERVGEELYETARRLRVYGSGTTPLEPRDIIGVVERSPSEIRSDLETGTRLLRSV